MPDGQVGRLAIFSGSRGPGSGWTVGAARAKSQSHACQPYDHGNWSLGTSATTAGKLSQRRGRRCGETCVGSQVVEAHVSGPRFADSGSAAEALTSAHEPESRSNSLACKILQRGLGSLTATNLRTLKRRCDHVADLGELADAGRASSSSERTDWRDAHFRAHPRIARLARVRERNGLLLTLHEFLDARVRKS